MCVEPQEGKPRPGHRRAEDQQFARARNVREQQVLAVDGATHHIGKDAQRAAHQYHRHDDETIKAVGQVHRVAGTDDHEVRQDDETEHAQRVADLFEERHDQVRLGWQVQREAAAHPIQEEFKHAHVAGLGYRERQVRGSKQADHGLPEELLARGHAFRVTMHDLAIVIHPADGAVAEGDQQHDPDEAVAPVRPQQRRHSNADEHQHATHGGRAGLDQVGLRAIAAHSLANLHFRQATDHPRPEPKADHQCREGCHHGPERQIVEDAQEAVVVLQPLRQCQ